MFLLFLIFCYKSYDCYNKKKLKIIINKDPTSLKRTIDMKYKNQQQFNYHMKNLYYLNKNFNINFHSKIYLLNAIFTCF